MKLNKTTKAMLLAVAATAFTSCASDDLINGNESSQNAIDFSTYVKTNSRALVSDIAAIKNSGFSVIAYRTVGDYASSTSTTIYMKNTPVTYNGTAWTYSPLQYWPENGDKLQFFAYSHADKSEDKEGDLAVNYDVLNNGVIDADKVYDLVTAKQLDQTRASSNGKVTFNFNHATSRIDIKARAVNTSGSTVYVTGLEIGGNRTYTGGMYSFVTGTWLSTWVGEKNTNGKEAASVSSTEHTYYSLEQLMNLSTDANTGVKGVELTTKEDELTRLFKGGDDGNHYFFAVPTDADVTAVEGDCYLKVTYAVASANGADGYNVHENKVKVIPLTTVIKQGRAYSVNFLIDPTSDAISFDMTETAWIDSDLDNNDVSGGSNTLVKEKDFKLVGSWGNNAIEEPFYVSSTDKNVYEATVTGEVYSCDLKVVESIQDESGIKTITYTPKEALKLTSNSAECTLDDWYNTNQWSGISHSEGKMTSATFTLDVSTMKLSITVTSE